MSTLFDPGLQPERTLLAWRRTALAFAVANAAVIRFASETIGPLAVLIGGAGVLISALSYVEAARRYRRVHTRLTSGDDLPGVGSAVLALTGATIAVGAGALAYVLG